MWKIKKKISLGASTWIINNTLELTVEMGPFESVSLACKLLDISKGDMLKFVFSKRLDKSLAEYRLAYIVSLLYPFGTNYNVKDAQKTLNELREQLIFVMMTAEDAPSRFEFAQFFNMNFIDILELEKRETKGVLALLKTQIILGMKDAEYSDNDIGRVVRLSPEEQKFYKLKMVTEDEILYKNKISGRLTDFEASAIRHEALVSLSKFAAKLNMNYEDFVSTSQDMLLGTCEDEIESVYIEEMNKNAKK